MSTASPPYGRRLFSVGLLFKFLIVFQLGTTTWSFSALYPHRRYLTLPKSSRVSSSELWESVRSIPSQEIYKQGESVELPGKRSVDNIFWRQSSEVLELWTPLHEDIQVRREVKVTISKTKVSLSIKSSAVAEIEFQADLLHPVNAEESSWFTETDNVPDSGPSRWLVLQLVKVDKYLNWASLVGLDSSSAVDETLDTSSSAGLQVGLREHDMRKTTQRQLDTYQRILAATNGASKNDVYVRKKKTPECFFVGKVCAEPGVCIAGAASSQSLLVKEYCRFLFPSSFSEVPDHDLDVLTASGDTEMLVAQDQIPLVPLQDALSSSTLPAPSSASQIGFEPEILEPEQKGFRVKRDEAGAPFGPPVQAKILDPSQIPA